MSKEHDPLQKLSALDLLGYVLLLIFPAIMFCACRLSLFLSNSVCKLIMFNVLSMPIDFQQKCVIDCVLETVTCTKHCN